jgi:hypothetical protein
VPSHPLSCPKPMAALAWAERASAGKQSTACYGMAGPGAFASSFALAFCRDRRTEFAWEAANASLAGSSGNAARNVIMPKQGDE